VLNIPARGSAREYFWFAVSLLSILLIAGLRGAAAV